MKEQMNEENETIIIGRLRELFALTPENLWLEELKRLLKEGDYK